METISLFLAIVKEQPAPLTKELAEEKTLKESSCP